MTSPLTPSIIAGREWGVELGAALAAPERDGGDGHQDRGERQRQAGRRVQVQLGADGRPGEHRRDGSRPATRGWVAPAAE
jgi:hypothetical protein